MTVSLAISVKPCSQLIGTAAASRKLNALVIRRTVHSSCTIENYEKTVTGTGKQTAYRLV